MRIAILSTIENSIWAGTEEVWYQFAKYALENEYEVLVLVHKNVSESDQVKELKGQGVKVSIRNPFKPTRLYLAKERYLPEHLKDLKKFKANVLLINSGSLLDVNNLPYLKRLVSLVVCKKIFFCHFVADLLVPHDRNAINTLLNKCESVIFVSVHNKSLAQRQLANRLPHSCVIPNASKFQLDAPLPFQNGDTVCFASVARFETLWKGQDMLLELLSSDKWKARDWRLNLYGSGHDEEYIRGLIEMYGLEAKVTIKGYKKDVKQLWQTNDVLLLPSRGEGMPLAVIEAMMCGKLVVCTDVGGNKEILEDGVSGFIAENYTVNAFNIALENAWVKRESWQNIGFQAFKAANELNINNPSKRLLVLINDFVSV
ncbi:glycosyltransferase family 4 protein [Mangrovimonas xylaniphaga]|uniref:glycosyltransferase family 4 protein n=1 Tax=Mangrovimonas xylaniphaga TaxID=1645915 RepID=UPI0006B64312|nr:glycosyltransferase family 4 protein [Mangrovimonas xylaniphaga]